MSFDTLAVTALRRDLEPAIVGGRVQKVLLAGELSVGLEIYGRGRTCRLRICASNNAPHALLASKPLRRATDRETPLLQLLRKYVRGGTNSGGPPAPARAHCRLANRVPP